jgi:hypothetical protein
MATAKTAPQYKRSWKNLLLNKRYQLRFTLFMVGVSALLMSGLGIWVMKEANEATTVAMIRVRGEACPKVPEVVEVPTPAAAIPSSGQATDAEAPKPAIMAPVESDVVAVKALWCLDATCTPELSAPLVVKANRCDDYVTKKLEDTDAVAALRRAQIPVVKCEGGDSHSVADAETPRRATVQLDEMSMTMTPTLPTDFADRIVAHHQCELRQASALDRLQDGRRRILWVLVATGILLMVGLAVYGIKMTHKVAGPLFKVSLYLAKMRDGRYDKVWNLRKGDQLVEFYEHFKHAHAGVVTMERADIERIQATIEAAEAAGLADHESITELRTLLARKEKALE